MPSQAGALWAQVGKNLIDGSAQVFETLMKSPLNPKVKANIQNYQKMSAAANQAIEQAQRNKFGYVQFGFDANGDPLMMPAAQTGTVWKPPLMGGAGRPGGWSGQVPPPRAELVNKQPTPPTPPTPPQTPTTPQTPSLATGSITTKQPAQGSVTQTGENEGVDASGNPVRRNPTTGNWEQTTDEQLQLGSGTGYQSGGFVQAPGALFAGRMGAPPPGAPGMLRRPVAAMMPPQQPMPMPPMPQGPPPMQQGPGPAGGPPSLHPVMSSQTALEWAKGFDTSTQRAVYLPQTPTGEPGFAFFGSKNKPLGPPIPISQMVRHGATGLAAGENLGSILSVADRQQAAAQQAQQPGPVRYMQPGGMVWNPQQPAPMAQAGPPQAPGTAYDPTAYQQAAPTAAQTAANPQGLFASNEPAGQPANTQDPQDRMPEFHLTPDQREANIKSTFGKTQQELAAAVANAKPDTTQMDGNNPLAYHDPDTGWDLYRDHLNSGELYAKRSDQAPFRSARFYLNTGEWAGGYQSPLTQLKEEVAKEYGGANSVVPGVKYTNDQVDHFDEGQLKGLLSKANEYHLSQNNPGPQDYRNALAQQVKIYQHLLDGQDWAKQRNVDPVTLNLASKALSDDAYKAQQLDIGNQRWNGLGQAVNAGWKYWHNLWAGNHPWSPLITNFEGELNSLGDTMAQTSKLQPNVPGEPSKATVAVPIQGEGFAAKPELTVPTGQKTTLPQELTDAFWSGNPKLARDTVTKYYNMAQTRLHDELNDSITKNYRLSPADKANKYALDNGLPLPDKDNTTGVSNNIFRDNRGRLIAPSTTEEGMKPFETAGPQPTPTPTPKPTPAPAMPSQTPEVKSMDELRRWMKNAGPDSPVMYNGMKYWSPPARQ